MSWKCVGGCVGGNQGCVGGKYPCWWIAEMALSDSQVRAIKATNKRQTISVGDSLLLIVEPLTEVGGGGKSFVGRTRFPPGRKGKQVDVRIGVYGKGIGKWSLKEARDQWIEIRAWSKENGINPKEWKRQQQVQESAVPTLQEAAEHYLEHADIKDRTKQGYRNMLLQAFPVLGADVPVDQFSWDHIGPSGKRGREVLMDYFRSVSTRAPDHARKSLLVLRGVFEHAIDNRWMEREQNPALGSKSTKSKKKSTPHPTLPWDQLPQFFQELEQNDANGNLITICAVKVVFMTFLRVGSLTPMRWSEVDEERGVWVVPADRMKNGKEHLVPLTNPLKDVLSTLGRINGAEEFVFASPRSRGTGYLNPSSINQHFIRMGYKGLQTAHGLRRTALTAGQDVLGFPSELIQRQMAHAIGDKVRQAYDQSQMLNERSKFMIAWCDALLSQGMKV